jgi:hypothetical protein
MGHLLPLVLLARSRQRSSVGTRFLSPSIAHKGLHVRAFAPLWGSCTAKARAPQSCHHFSDTMLDRRVLTGRRGRSRTSDYTRGGPAALVPTRGPTRVHTDPTKGGPRPGRSRPNITSPPQASMSPMGMASSHHVRKRPTRKRGPTEKPHTLAANPPWKKETPERKGITS